MVSHLRGINRMGDPSVIEKTVWEKTARAKINLCLHVTGQDNAGYHTLDSLVVLGQYGDVLRVVPQSPAHGFSLQIEGAFGADLPVQNNIILSAAEGFADLCGADITLIKNLPICAGLGGGSADAAAILQILSQICDHPLPADNGLSLGADVPVCLAGRAVRMRGIGADLSPIKLPPLSAVLVCPNFPLSTASVFQNLADKNNTGLDGIVADIDSFAGVIDLLRHTRNDLQSTSIQACPMIDDVLEALTQAGAGIARMSGSGPSCFGLFPTMNLAQNAAKRLMQANPEWWVIALTIND